MSNTVTLTVLVAFLSMTCLNFLECAPMPQVKTTLSPLEEILPGNNVLSKSNSTILEETVKGDNHDAVMGLLGYWERKRKYEEEKRNRELEETRKVEQERRDRIDKHNNNKRNTGHDKTLSRPGLPRWAWVIIVVLVFCVSSFLISFACSGQRIGGTGTVCRAPITNVSYPITPAISPNCPTTTTEDGFLPVTGQNAPIQQPERSPLLNDGRQYPTQTNYSYPVPQPQPQPQPTIVPSAPTNVEPELDLPPSYDELDLPPDRQRNKRGNISGPSW